MAALTGRKPSVLFVCFGNTCRSTMAEAIFLHLISKRGEHDMNQRIIAPDEGLTRPKACRSKQNVIILQWTVDSAGISDYNVGLPPNPRTLSTLQKNGISLAEYHHTSRLLTREDYHRFDIIFGMDEYNLMDLQELQPRRQCRAQLQLLGDWDPQGKRIIYDPLFTRGTEAFDKVYEQCMRCLTAFLSAPCH